MKKFLLMLAMMLPCLGAWAEIEVSTSVETPKATYSLLSKNGFYMSAGTGSTQFNIGRFAFFGGTNGAYKIYSVDAQKWVSYTQVESYSGNGGANKAELIESQAEALEWNVVENGGYYNIAPYLKNGEIAGFYWNFHGGAGASGKTYIYDDGKTIGLYNEKGDGGSLWKLEKLTLATEEDVNAAKALIAVAPGYPKTTTTAYTKLNTLTTGATITNKHVEVIVNAYKTESNVILPEDGKAYTITAKFQDGKKYHLNYTAGSKLAVSSSTTASTFVCKELRTGVYAFVTEDGHLLTWIGNKETGAYKEGNGGINGYSSYFGTTFDTKSDWNEFTVKKNDTHQEQFGLLRLVARRKNNAFSSLIAESSGRFDEAGDANFHNATYTSGWILTEVEHTNTDAQNIALKKIDAKLVVSAKIPGETVCKYTYKNGDNDITNVNDVNSAIDNCTSVAAVEAISNSATINMPVRGKFYRFKHPSRDAYMLSDRYNDKYLAMGALAAGSNNVTSIFYYGESGNLLSYAIGRYLSDASKSSNDWKCLAVGTVGNAATFGTGSQNGTLGFYVGSDKTRAYYSGNAQNGYVNAGGSFGSNAGYDWVLEEVTELPITITDAGYATFYAPVAVRVEGVTANTVTVNGEWATLNEIGGGVIPANTGVVLSGEANTYNLTITETTETIESGLEGTVASTYITDEAYALGYINVAEEGEEEKKEVGFYTAKMTNGQWLNNGFKAYLPKTVQAQVLRFNFGGTTGIEDAIVVPSFNANAPIFDLSGRRVMNTVKGGIYIQNGKKFIVK